MIFTDILQHLIRKLTEINECDETNIYLNKVTDDKNSYPLIINQFATWNTNQIDGIVAMPKKILRLELSLLNGSRKEYKVSYFFLDTIDNIGNSPLSN